MNTNYNNKLDLTKLNNSMEIISSLDSCLKATDLSSYIIDIEEIIKNSNFEHNNYIVNYKTELNDIISDIENIKCEVDKLNEALYKTNASYQKNFYNDDDIKELSNLYPSTDFSNINNSFTNLRDNLLTSSKGIIDNGSITRIPSVSENTTTINEHKQYNMAPIGLGIAATITSSVVGAMIVDKKEKSIIPTVVHKKNVHNNVENKTTTIDDPKQENNKDTIEIPTTYQASRQLGSKDIFYNDSSDEYFSGQ